jgi:hypothetical protein
MRQEAMLLACVAGAFWLLSFGFAQAPDQDSGKKTGAPKDDKLPPGKEKAMQKLENKASEPVKAGTKKESKTPVADLLNAAVDGLLGNRAKMAVVVPRNMAKMAVVAPQKAQADVMAQQIEQQYAPRFRQLYKSELHFMRLVCQPTRQQYEKISVDGDTELKASIKKFVMEVAEQRQGRMRQDARQPDARMQITSGIANKVKARLSPEQAARYAKELEERDAARRRVVLLNLLSGIDKKVVLTAEQRDKVSEILTKNWHDSWNQTQLLMQGGQYFPAMPDDKILPVLTDTQKAVWQKVQKGNVFFGNTELDWFQGIEIEDEVWSERGAKK